MFRGFCVVRCGTRGFLIDLARPRESLLHGVHATDAVSFIFAGVVLVTVTAVAALVPALRAARIDPIEVLRAE